MYHHRLVISYKGTHYFGWQDLGGNETKPTVEASIHQVLRKICKYQDCTLSAASRTDAGVHAQGQVAKVSIPLIIDSQKLLQGLNSLLPDDIRILGCESCSDDFNANKDAKAKEYHYYFCTDEIHNPVHNETVAHIPSCITKPLDIALMQNACKLFIGEHDFYSFAKRDVNIRSTVRTMLSCEIVPVHPHPAHFGSTIYSLKIEGNGFLKHLVRYIAGALFAVGRNELSLVDISEALESHKEDKLSSSAKSRGLHLVHIRY